ncbi:pilus assembly protein TadB [Kutzneria buriramensis]|uniref:Flp pilus assembly protein TadB n=1 Tax=Kutzneria buriramensis TaxID=1045776 RepID=A0A3E0GV65_9PSEU|nr:pilus assembly protein TadB [Kutzneria buriramensis]REH28638.1 Flp pilus assembly protein TadB [Kutzneria buriramensis]
MNTELVLLGLGVAAGVLLIAAALLPARRESLVTAIARVDAINADPDQPVRPPMWWRAMLEQLTASCARSTLSWWRIPAADLIVLNRTPLAFTTRRTVAAGMGALITTVVAVRVLPSAQFPIAAAVAGAVVGWVLPARVVARAARQARVEFVAAIAVLCDLTAQERDAGRAPAQAVAEAAAVAEGWVSVMVRARLRSAQRLGNTPWDALSALAEQIQVREVADLGEIIATASDGAAISRALRDKAAALRVRAVQADTAAATARVEWLVWPVGLLVIGMTALVLRGIATQIAIP